MGFEAYVRRVCSMSLWPFIHTPFLSLFVANLLLDKHYEFLNLTKTMVNHFKLVKTTH